MPKSFIALERMELDLENAETELATAKNKTPRLVPIIKDRITLLEDKIKRFKEDHHLTPQRPRRM